MAPPTKHGPDLVSFSSSSSSFTSTFTESSDHHHCHHSNNHSNQSQNKKHSHNIRYRDNHKEPNSNQDKDLTNTRNDNKLATTATNTQPPNSSLISSIAKLLRMDRRSDQDENLIHQDSRHVSEPGFSFEAQHSENVKEQARIRRHRPSQTTSELAHSLESNYRMLPLMIGCIVPVSMVNHSLLPLSFPPSFTPFLHPLPQNNKSTWRTIYLLPCVHANISSTARVLWPPLECDLSIHVATSAKGTFVFDFSVQCMLTPSICYCFFSCSFL
ncbi:MAG: hypothetical protein BYD32DRAFT_162325 [Podila humilis]|nr:MAG: hypothetical protein BYD32DRAFT_162325 [Podila humilis]